MIEFIEPEGPPIAPQSPLAMFVVFYDPLDYPDKWVVRRWEITRDGGTMDAAPLAVTDTHEGIMQVLPEGLTRMSRWNNDEPHVVEVWL